MLDPGWLEFAVWFMVKTAMQRIKLFFLATLLIAPLTAFAQEDPAEAETAGEVDMVIRDGERPRDVQHGERVDRVFAPNISDFRVVDNKRVILYATRFRPYLVVLRRPARGLSVSSAIGLKRRDSNIDARFDSIYVDGFPYSIDYIEKLTPETAKRLLGIEPRKKDQEPPKDDPAVDG